MSLGINSWRSKAPGLTDLVVALLVISTIAPAALANPTPLKAEPVAGWPELRIETHYVARIAMRGHCLPVPAGTPIPDTALDSCARPDFWRGACDIFIDVQSMRRAELLEHEKMRCRGHDYRDDDRLAEALRAWREQGENRYADMLDFASLMFVLEPLTE